MNKYNGKIKVAVGQKEQTIIIVRTIGIVAGAIATMAGGMLNLLEKK